MICDGPWIWYPCTEGAVLECAKCHEITVTGNFNNAEHTNTPVLMEGT